MEDHRPSTRGRKEPEDRPRRGGVYTFLGPLPFNNHFTPVCQIGKITDFGGK